MVIEYCEEEWKIQNLKQVGVDDENLKIQSSVHSGSMTVIDDRSAL